MNSTRAQICSALDALIEEKNGIAFQRLACQCLHSQWPSLMATAEQADLGEDAVTVTGEGVGGVIRSLACSLTANWSKVCEDAQKIAAQHSGIQELVFATPKTVRRKEQRKWQGRISDKFGWNLIVVERAEFLRILERPEAQFICKQHLGLTLGYLHSLKSAETLRESRETEAALKRAQNAERGALDAGDWEAVCRTQLLLGEIHLDKEGVGANYASKALEALTTAREHNLTSLLAECLIQRANSIGAKDPKKTRRLLDEAEALVGPNVAIQRWLYLTRAELEHGEGNLDEAEHALREWEALVGHGKRADRQSYHHIAFHVAAKRGEHAEALDHLNKALKRARRKKRWMSAGRMLQDKARFLAHAGSLRRGAREAEKAVEIFEKLKIEGDSFDSAILAGHLFFESHDAERALGWADYVLSKVDPKTYGNTYLDALQLKTKALQILSRIEEARECNRQFRELAAYKPQSLVVADIQDAMLWADSGDYEEAEAMFKSGLERAKRTNAQEEIVAAIKVHWAQVKMDQAEYYEARSLAEAALGCADTLPAEIRDHAAQIAKIAEGRAPITSVFEDLLSDPAPLELAGTGESKTVQEAHRELLRPLLEWTDTWPEHLQWIYDFWGRGNLARYMLNHRGFENAFHVTVEARTVPEARQWTRVLCPLVDVLTILWKGPFLGSGMVLVPVHRSYEGAGGWGYAICAGERWRPDKGSEDWNWSPALGWATPLPKDAVEFLFSEARGLFEAGNLFLLPALHVGCLDPGHGPLERMFNDVVHASPFLSCEGNNRGSLSLDSLALPYFPDVPLHELARMVKGEGDSLLKTRLVLREWARTLAKPDKIETRDAMLEIHERIEVALAQVEHRFDELAEKLEWAKQDGTINSYSFDAAGFEATPEGSAAGQLEQLHGELRASPWYGYFRLSSQGYQWDLLKRNARAKKGASKGSRPERVHHWLVPPRAGWTIPTVVRA